MSGAARLSIAAGLAVVVLVPCGLGALALATIAPASGCDAIAVTGRSAAAWSPEGRWDAAQVGNAETIVTVGADLRVPPDGWVIALATAMRESGLRNLGYLGSRNDHDSLGLFQQRPSQGWGTPAQLTDPAYAATKFYEKLLRVPGWQQMPVTEAAQAVQVSAYPNAYAKHEADARALVSLVSARLGLAQGCALLPSAGWVAPLPAGSYRLSSPYGPRWGSFHYGQDFATSAGTPIRSAAAGVVVLAGCTSPYCDRPGRVDTSGMPVTRGCGWTVIIQHPGRVASKYCHARALAVHSGQSVAPGQVIGWVGSTGNSTGDHLHFQIHRDTPPVDNSTAVDPVAYLASVGVQV